MTDQEIRQTVNKKLAPFIRNFDMENRGNRVSQVLSVGLGALLEDLIVDIIIRKQNKDVPSGKSD